jgi:hypothetical protein
MSDVERQGSVMWGRVDEGKEAAPLSAFLARAAAMGSAQAYKRGRSISRLAAADWARPCFPAPSPDDAEVLDAADPTPCRP